jgi:hypothetical protein
MAALNPRGRGEAWRAMASPFCARPSSKRAATFAREISPRCTASALLWCKNATRARNGSRPNGEMMSFAASADLFCVRLLSYCLSVLNFSAKFDRRPLNASWVWGSENTVSRLRPWRRRTKRKKRKAQARERSVLQRISYLESRRKESVPRSHGFCRSRVWGLGSHLSVDAPLVGFRV